MRYLRLWWLHLLLIAALAFTLAMGTWQWTVGADKRSDASAKLAHLAPVPLESVLGPDDAFPKKESGRPVTVSGAWLPETRVFVADHQDGYWVAEALRLEDAAAYVVLGWTPTTDVEVPEPASTTVTGWIQPPENAGLYDDDPDDDVLPELSSVNVLDRVDGDLYAAYVVSGTPAPGLEAAQLNQPLDPGLKSGLRNFLYAFEWWFFAAFAVFFWWRWLRDLTTDPLGSQA